MRYLAFITLLFLSGCALKLLHVKNNLPNLLQEKGMSEYKELSLEAYFISKKLKTDYELVSPPLFHNFLVNAGIKTRGLCWHFAYDMSEHFRSKGFKDVDF